MHYPVAGTFRHVVLESTEHANDAFCVWIKWYRVAEIE